MRIESAINERLIGDVQKRALDFVSYLRDNEMQFEREVGGQPKTIFGKVFNNTCGTTFCFKNPSCMELECLKKLMQIRKNDILKNA